MTPVAGPGWGIVGPGAIARTFAESLRRHDAGRLERVTGRSPGRSAAFCRDVGGRPAVDLDELLTDTAVQAVYIATPHPQHLEPALRCLEAGRAVLCEKPMTVRPEDTTRLVAAARRLRVPLVEAWMYRCHPQVGRLLQLLAEGTLGRPVALTSGFCFAAPFDPRHRLFDPELGGGAILDVGGYPVSLALLVAAAMGETGEPEVEAVRGQLTPSGVDGRAEARLRFANGFTARVAAAVTADEGSGAVLECEQGRVVLDTPFLVADGRHGVTARLRWQRDGGPEQVAALSAATDHYAAEALAVARMLADPAQPLEPPPPMVGLDESLRIARVLARWRSAVLAGVG